MLGAGFWCGAWCLVLLLVLVLLLGSRLLHESHERSPHRPDVPSVVLSALGLASLLYGIIESSTYGWVKAKAAYEVFSHSYTLGDVSVTAYALSLAVLLLAIFWYRQAELQRRGKTPLIVHRPPVHEALRRVGVEPMLTH